ncbi:hypothetical protein TNCT_403011 [Trichonephila clavata]|uniref:Uncharacterized protein n=1 Tax=Trichonephila clavata TaxID=2740835 RepID=A0A8X6FE49_TRICU|nr:hypothetical protein TNCT_403011 [Trichonephila clavata]
MEVSIVLENTARIFATQLVHFVVTKHYTNWIPEALFEDYVFPEFMQKEMVKICQLNSFPFWCEFCQSFAGKEKTAETFEEFCSCMSVIIQHQEVNTERFLNYAGKLAVFSSYIYTDYPDAPNIAASYITFILVTRYPYVLQKKPFENESVPES